MTTRRQKIIIEYCPTNSAGNWWIMLEDGTVIPGIDTVKEAAAIVRKVAAKRNPGVTIQIIEWRNIPEGFKLP